MACVPDRAKETPAGTRLVDVPAITSLGSGETIGAPAEPVHRFERRMCFVLEYERGPAVKVAFETGLATLSPGGSSVATMRNLTVVADANEGWAIEARCIAPAHVEEDPKTHARFVTQACDMTIRNGRKEHMTAFYVQATGDIRTGVSLDPHCGG
jgi:hypothetical protein